MQVAALRSKRRLRAGFVRRRGVLPLLLGAALLTGCDGEARRLADANAALERGEYARGLEALAELESAQALALRASLEQRAQGLEQDLARLERLAARAPEPPEHALVAELDAFARGRSEPRLRDALERARSRVADRYAEARARGKRWTDAGQEPRPEGAQAPTPEEEAALPQALALLGLAQEARDPSDAAAGALEPEPVAREPEDRQADALARQAAEQPTAAGPEPDTGAAARAASSSADWTEVLAGLEDPLRLADWARDQELDGHPTRARAGFARALAFTPEAEERARLEGELARLEARLQLRREIAQAIPARAREYAELGVLGVVEDGPRFDGRPRAVAWKALTTADWAALAKPARLSPEARLGFAMELLDGGDEPGGDRLLAQLLTRDSVEPDAVSRVVAWYRGEELPPGGYERIDDAWVPQDDARRADDAARAAALARSFPRLARGPRDDAYDELFALGRRDLCLQGLEQRWQRVAERFEHQRGRRELESMAEARHELDRLRAETLERIEDTFLYPADATTGEDQERKRTSQRFINEQVEVISELQEDTRAVALGRALRALIEETLWLSEREFELRAATSRPKSLPPWLAAIDPEARQLELAAFAWSLEEGRDLARDRAVRARNRGLFEAARREAPNGDEAQVSAAEEYRQVVVTNDYRLLLGRRALAWNPLLQGAAYDHSDYMSRTGDFGHGEDDPARATPGARMARRGYTRPGGENCYAGGADAGGAHTAWIHSPGHHRNLISASHAEMASSLVGRYWTQVFGGDPGFLQELDEWSD